MKIRTCISPEGKFIYGIHKPAYSVNNLRETDILQTLGSSMSGERVDNAVNFPVGDIKENQAEWIYEIPNPFPFKGTTYIGKSWADSKADDPTRISISPPKSTSMTDSFKKLLDEGELANEKLAQAFQKLPETVLLALASTSTDPADLVRLVAMCCELEHDPDTREVSGIRYQEDARGRLKPAIHNHNLFEALVNNPYLPDRYKEIMVLRAGVQGSSEIMGEWPVDRGSHVFEYLRRNSYIPWGHFASNMANDAVRYHINDLSEMDFTGLRHLYYQRTFLRLAEQLGMQMPETRRCLQESELEDLRRNIIGKLAERPGETLQFDATIWGWNYGFDFSASGYRLHASHQQIHQQFAMVPGSVSEGQNDSQTIPSYSCGDLVTDFVRQYNETNDSSFFEDYIRAIRNNSRLDNRNDLEKKLVVYEDKNVMLFVPKAQTSQWELQLMTLGPVGNILESDNATRQSLNLGILTAMQVLTAIGARLITVIEYSKRFTVQDIDQRLLYCFLPKLPQSMGAFSEAQLRFINGHYPEDFAVACRTALNRA
jgi:hypothetical protein